MGEHIMNEKSKKIDSEQKGKSKYRLTIALILAALFLFIIVVMIINSRKPQFMVLKNIDSRVKGAHFIKTNISLIEKMYENWLPNDIFWPTAFLDNMPHFQIGVLEVVRYNTRVLRNRRGNDFVRK